MAVSIQVVIDCADPDRLADFWAAVLEYRKDPPPPGYNSWQDWLKERNVPESEWNSASAVSDPAKVGSRIFFQRVPEPKTVKNRVHLDIGVTGGPRTPLEERKAKVSAALERVTALGATQVREVEQRGEYWVVMQDPEGNEFCLH